MYLVTMQNGTTLTEIQNEYHKLFSGSIVKGINTIDSFTFSILPDNPAFGALRDFTTLVSVYNLARQRYEFYGRVLYTSPQMNDKGLITQEAICESYLGFLCDSQQEYVEEQNWTVRGLLEHIISRHNSQVEEYKHFALGQVWADADPNNNLYVGIQRENTWETLKKKLLETLGGEVRFRVVDGLIYLDYVEKLGTTCSTEIALSKNMKSIVKEKNPSAFITRLIPLGGKEYDSNENSRYDITSVNGGKNYIDDTAAIVEYGLHVGYVEFDDVTEPSILLTKARAWLRDNNKVSVKYSITALDLSLIGLDVDDFDVCNTYPLKNSLLGIDDTARINKKTIDVCDETKTSIEIGESFKTLSEIQREAVSSIGKLNANVAEIIRNYATNERLASEITRTVSLIEQTEEKIALSVAGTYASQDALRALESSISLTESSILSKVSATYATQASLDGYATTDSLDDYATKDSLDDYATKASLSAYVTQSSLEQTASSITASVSATYATKDSLSDYATQDSLDNYATKDSLDDYATQEALESAISLTESSILSTVSATYATKDSLSDYVTQSSLEQTANSIMATVSATYATQDSLNDYVTQSSLEQTANSITASVSSTYATRALAQLYAQDAIAYAYDKVEEVRGSLALEVVTAADGSKYSQLRADVDKVLFNSGEIEIRSDNFNLEPDGTLVIYASANQKVSLHANGVSTYYKRADGTWYEQATRSWSAIVGNY